MTIGHLIGHLMDYMVAFLPHNLGLPCIWALPTGHLIWDHLGTQVAEK